MTALYGCIVCGTPRPTEKEWNWLSRHRALDCPTAVWGRLDG